MKGANNMETKNVEKLQIVTNIFLILFCIFSMFVMTLAEIRRPSVTPTTGTTEVATAATGTTTPTPVATETPTATDKKDESKSATSDKKNDAVKPAEKPADTPSTPKTK
jgi:hypothetical protein